MKIIGISGKAYTGKDTIADYLVQAHQFRKLAFGDRIKDIISLLYSQRLAGLEFHGETAKEMPIPGMRGSMRELMQTLGQWARRFDDGVWIEPVKREMARFLRCTGVQAWPAGFVICDVRLEHEAHWIRSMGGVIWHVTRKDAPAARVDETEKGTLLYPEKDEWIENDQSQQDLPMKIDQLLAGAREATDYWQALGLEMSLVHGGRAS